MDPIPFSKPSITESEEQFVVGTLRSGWLSRGPLCASFEAAFCAYAGCKHAISLNSGTAALHLALLAHGIGYGDYVIVPTMTFPATVNAVLYTGAKPVLIDCGEDYNYDYGQLQAAAAAHSTGGHGRVQAVIGVDMHGLPCEYPLLPPGVLFIRDAAHSVGALNPLGRIGRAQGETTCFSFYATKNLACGEGGMLTTNDDEVAERVRRLSQHGMSADAWKRHAPGAQVETGISEIGFNAKMTDLAAALGSVQLEKLDPMIRRRRSLAGQYHDRLAELAAKGRIILPPWKQCWHVYAIRVADRDAVAAALRERGIGCGVHFRPVHDLPYLQPFGTGSGAEEAFPMACKLGRETLSLPLYPDLTVRQIEQVVQALEEILERQA